MTTQVSEPQVQEMATPTDFPDIIGGDPVAAAPEAAPVQEPEVAAPSAPAKKYWVGTQSFDSPEEALAYANGMNQAQAQAAASLVNRPEPVQQGQKKTLGDLFFDDPNAALEQVKLEAKEEALKEQRALEQTRKVWEDFYSRHPDLRGHEFLVDAILGRENQAGTFNGMTTAQGAPVLAQKVREEVLRIKGVANGGQALPSKPAMVAGASGASAPQVQTRKPQPTSFVDELKGARKRG